MSMVENLKQELKFFASKDFAKTYGNFFKTGKGEYGEKDIFLGIKVPVQRSIAQKYPDIPRKDLLALMKSEIHEFRITAYLVLIEQFKRGDEATQEEIFDFYLANLDCLQSWDEVDLTAPYILGIYLLDKPAERSILYDLARSESLWRRRVAMITAWMFIRQGQFDDALRLASVLVHNKEDLIQKAVGWMLREIGKRNLALEEKFLKKHYRTMPRTMLRYAIEKFEQKKRDFYLGR